MATKGEIVEEAYDTLGVGGNYESNMIMRGVKNLQRLMLAWEDDGILLGYVSTGEDASPSDESGIPDYALQAVVLNLAVQLAAVLRMPVDQSVKSMAGRAYKNLIPIDGASLASNPFMPTGQGGTRCFYGEAPKYQAQDDSDITTESDINITMESGS